MSGRERAMAVVLLGIASFTYIWLCAEYGHGNALTTLQRFVFLGVLGGAVHIVFLYNLYKGAIELKRWADEL